MNSRDERRQFLHAVLAVCFGGAIAVVGVAWQIADLRADQERARCESDVAANARIRSMWEWAGDTLAGNPDPETAAFGVEMQEQLAELLPPLKCDGSIPIPMED
jgi:hypothetical protein